MKIELIDFKNNLAKYTDIKVIPIRKTNEGIVRNGYSENIKTILSTPDFQKTLGNTIYIPGQTCDARRGTMLVWAGSVKDRKTDMAREQLGAKIYTALAEQKAESAMFDGTGLSGREVALICNGANLQSYVFDKFKTAKNGRKLQTLLAVPGSIKSACRHFNKLNTVSEGVFWARDLVNRPGNDLYPDNFANEIAGELSKLDVRVDIRNFDALKEMSAGGIVNVGKGSGRLPRMVTMEWNGGVPGSPPIAFVGKGVTFDSGGISLKPGSGMEEMVNDMGGSAAVVGAMMALARLKVPANIVGVVGLTENMPDGNAMRPGDIITSMSGKTIRVINTDAEGRLVLMDCLWHAQQAYKPYMIADYATLTGASFATFGGKYAALFSNAPDLSEAFAKAGRETNEELYELPWKVYGEMLKDQDADLVNGVKTAGACSAAAFLSNFIQDGVKWAHIDMAGTAKTTGAHGCGQRPCYPAGATGYGVRQITKFIQNTLG